MRRLMDRPCPPSMSYERSAPTALVLVVYNSAGICKVALATNLCARAGASG